MQLIINKHHLKKNKLSKCILNLLKILGIYANWVWCISYLILNSGKFIIYQNLKYF